MDQCLIPLKSYYILILLFSIDQGFKIDFSLYLQSVLLAIHTVYNRFIFAVHSASVMTLIVNQYDCVMRCVRFHFRSGRVKTCKLLC